MSVPERASLRSPFRSRAALVSALHGWIRRHRVGRLALIVTAATAAGLWLTNAINAAEAERARWGPTTPAWVTTVDVPAGALLDPSHVVLADIPSALRPANAATESPAGLRATTSLGAGEIVLSSRLSTAGSPHGARTPHGTAAIVLDRTHDLFTVGDRVDLHDQVDGGRLAVDAEVIAVTDRDIAVAVDADRVGEVVRGLGRAGVIIVLRSGASS